MVPNYTLLSETILVSRFKSGDNNAGNELFIRFKTRLFGMCMNITLNNDLAAEVVQETFFRLLKIRDRLDPTKNFSAFIHKMAFNYCMDELRKKKKKVNLDDFSWVEQEIPAIDEVFVNAEDTFELKKVWEAVAKLPSSARTLIELRYRSVLTPDQIAEVLEVPASTVRVRLHRARKTLAGLLISCENRKRNEKPL